MNNILNRYSISSDLETYCFHDDESKIVFVLANHKLKDETVISEETAKLLCLTSDSTITESDWDDFKNGTREFRYERRMEHRWRHRLVAKDATTPNTMNKETTQ